MYSASRTSFSLSKLIMRLNIWKCLSINIKCRVCNWPYMLQALHNFVLAAVYLASRICFKLSHFLFTLLRALKLFTQKHKVKLVTTFEECLPKTWTRNLTSLFSSLPVAVFLSALSIWLHLKAPQYYV